MEDFEHPFPVALTATRAGNLLTTHTAVDAGFDRFAQAWKNTSATMLVESSSFPSNNSSRWGGKILATDPNPSTWPISRCEAAVQ